MEGSFGNVMLQAPRVERASGASAVSVIYETTSANEGEVRAYLTLQDMRTGFLGPCRAVIRRAALSLAGMSSRLPRVPSGFCQLHNGG